MKKLVLATTAVMLVATAAMADPCAVYFINIPATEWKGPPTVKMVARCTKPLKTVKALPYANLIDPATGLVKTDWLIGPLVVKKGE